MRKPARLLVILFCLVCMAVSAGCSPSLTQPVVNPVLTFEAKADVSMGKSRYICRLQYSAGQGAQLTLLEPQELQGMTWAWDHKILSVSYEGLTVSQDNMVLPQTGMIPMMLASLDAASVEGALTTSGDGLFFGSGDGHNFTLTADRRTGQIKQLAVPEENMLVLFEPITDSSEESK
ncbi:hypothetical protein [Faecalispora jeddahensis]|jgi:hypothetical protein|uniref:hypothetical protein n=1 Tax=Faecalispora jeddahensis TaxID=1414721 RepID=UPI001896F837|nr:hypothetical protein [Faecalispora jeddahensis]